MALEDPGYVEAWTAFSAEGSRTVPVPVDDDGLDPETLPAGCAAVYVTPSHQYPLGARMPVTRRVALLEWARTTGGLVIEDDYDGEFRYDVSPLPALRSLPGAAEHVVYVGTASKLLAPSLRVAWVAVPPRLRDPLRVALESRGLAVNEPTGLALAAFVESGALSAHHARVSRTYAARRAALVAAVERHLPGATLAGVDAGLHVVLRLPDEVDDHEATDRCRAAGVAVSPLSAYAVDSPVRGLVLCYAGLPESRADDAVRLLASVVRPVEAPRGGRVMTSPSPEVRLAELATRWSSTRDLRAVFADCYRLMTVRLGEGVRDGLFEDGPWVARLRDRFADYYFDALDAYADADGTHDCPRTWRSPSTPAPAPAATRSRPCSSASTRTSTTTWPSPSSTCSTTGRVSTRTPGPVGAATTTGSTP